MKKTIQIVILLFLGAIITMSNTEGCTNDDSQKFRSINFTTNTYNYACTYESPAKLVKDYHNSPGEGELRIITTDNATGLKFNDRTIDFTSSFIDCGNLLTCCVTTSAPFNSPYKLTAYYIQYGNFISCSTGQPNLCHTWTNTNLDYVYPAGYDPDCANWSITLNDWIGEKTCSF